MSGFFEEGCAGCDAKICVCPDTCGACPHYPNEPCPECNGTGLEVVQYEDGRTQVGQSLFLPGVVSTARALQIAAAKSLYSLDEERAACIQCIDDLGPLDVLDHVAEHFDAMQDEYGIEAAIILRQAQYDIGKLRDKQREGPPYADERSWKLGAV